MRESGHYIPLIRRFFAITTGASILLVCFLCTAQFLALIPRIFLLDDVGYGDSYVLHDVQRFQRTGIIYPDLSQPPYTAVAYSPFLYVLYSLPARLGSWQNPFVGPRLIALSSFLLCLAVSVSIARRLVPWQNAWLWAVLLGPTILSMHVWILQLRGDFPAILCSLIAIRLLLTESPRNFLLAGLFAGFAIQIRYTMIAATVAGLIWLLARKQWRNSLRFAVGAFSTSITLYLYWAWREPRMISQLTSLKIGIVDVSGCLSMIRTVLTEPVSLLALAAIPFTTWTVSAEWALVAVFAVISFAFGALTNLHPGGNINYFYEALFALIPAATAGLLRVIVWSKRWLIAGILLAVLVLTQFAYPRLVDVAFLWLRGDFGFNQVELANQQFQRKQKALDGEHIFSTMERVSLLDPSPALVSAFNLWMIDPGPIYRRLAADEFDVVVTSVFARTWRGIDHITPSLHAAITESYEPYCQIDDILIHLPRRRPVKADFLERLAQAGCTRISNSTVLKW